MSAVAKTDRFGDDVVARELTIDGASFLLADAPRPERCGIHSHDQVLISFLLKGEITEVDERGRKIDCGPFSLHTTPPGIRHAHLIRSPRVTTLCFTLDAAMLAGLGETARVFDQPITTKLGSVAALAPRFQKELLATDSASDLVLQGLIYQLAGELARKKGSRLPSDCPAWLHRAKELLHDSWNRHLSIEEIAYTVGVHPSHLNRVFRAHMHQTPGEYVRSIRMERATRDVVVSDLPLKAIAAQAGFSDQAHFTREFRRRHGMSPMEMRRQIRID